MTAWREMDCAQKWAFGLRFTSFSPMLLALRYHLLWADPKYRLPRLEFLPSPFEMYSEFIPFGSYTLAMLSMFLFSHIQRKRFLERM